jgi:hypothetical protein
MQPTAPFPYASNYGLGGKKLLPQAAKKFYTTGLVGVETEALSYSITKRIRNDCW